MSKVITGKDIRDVWDWRLSRGNPILYCDGPFWIIRIWDNKAPDGERILLKEIETDIPSTRNPHDHEAVAKCHKLLREIRDEFSRDHLELRKPVVAMINEANKKANEIRTAADTAKAEEDIDGFKMLMGEYSAHLSIANASIKAATEIFHKKVSDLAGGAS